MTAADCLQLFSGRFISRPPFTPSPTCIASRRLENRMTEHAHQKIQRAHMSEAREWVIREADLLHLLSVKIGAAYVNVEDALQRTELSARRYQAGAALPATAQAEPFAISGNASSAAPRSIKRFEELLEAYVDAAIQTRSGTTIRERKRDLIAFLTDMTREPVMLADGPLRRYLRSLAARDWESGSVPLDAEDARVIGELLALDVSPVRRIREIAKRLEGVARDIEVVDNLSMSPRQFRLDATWLLKLPLVRDLPVDDEQALVIAKAMSFVRFLLDASAHTTRDGEHARQIARLLDDMATPDGQSGIDRLGALLSTWTEVDPKWETRLRDTSLTPSRDGTPAARSASTAARGARTAPSKILTE
ncbi:hypothetical protein [Paraburkholderia sp. SIMBA_054]|uniref:hypothetical protein n=1 Tax=Paraburkholderia sp. SIMBA_054 TaxID=3085795 RepID=UPI00397D2B53